MKVCTCCKGNCDSGELVQGLCQECMEKEKKKREDFKNLLGKNLKAAFSPRNTNSGGGGIWKNI